MVKALLHRYPVVSTNGEISVLVVKRFVLVRVLRIISKRMDVLESHDCFEPLERQL